MPDDVAEIRDLISSFERALNAGDAALARGCYIDDGVFMPAGGPTALGRDVGDTYARIFSAIELNLSFEVKEIVVASKTRAFVLTESRGVERDLASGQSHADSNRELFLLTRPDGAWKISHLIFNRPS